MLVMSTPPLPSCWVSRVKPAGWPLSRRRCQDSVPFEPETAGSVAARAGPGTRTAKRRGELFIKTKIRDRLTPPREVPEGEVPEGEVTVRTGRKDTARWVL